MIQPKTILLTGGSGFLGIELLKRLTTLNHNVILLMRRKNGDIPTVRLQHRLLRSGLDIDKTNCLLEKIEIIEGDIGSPELGVDSFTLARLRESVDKVLHCAASTKFAGIDRDEMFKTNYLGSLNLIKFCLSGRKKHFHAISSAYVAGNKSGIVHEDELDDTSGFRNYYEETKFLTEKVIHRFAQLYDLTFTIYRPSIIIGDSKSYYTMNFDGIYTFARSLLLLKRRFNSLKLKKMQYSTTGGVCREEINGNQALIENDLSVDQPPVRLPASPKSTLNLIPIDYAADAVVTIFNNKERRNKTFHIVNPNPPMLSFLMDIICDAVGFFDAEIIDHNMISTDQLTRFEKVTWKSIEPYISYLMNEPYFMSDNTSGILNSLHIRCPEITKQYISSVIDYAIRHKWGNAGVRDSEVN